MRGTRFYCGVAAVILIGLESVAIWRSFAIPSVQNWPEPRSGFRNEQIDYSVPKFPDAEVVAVPLVDLDNLEKELIVTPVVVARKGHGIIFEGTVRHPHPKMKAVVVMIRVRNRHVKGSSMALSGHAQGEGGHLKYRIQGRVTVVPGEYDAEVEIRYRTTDPNKLTLPREQQMLTAVVAKGVVKVTE